jgi:PhnB protein
MASINPHINFNGNAEEAFIFYKSVFGGEFAKIIRFKDLASAEFPVADHEANKIMHIALPIGKSILMANDVPEILGRTNENENRSKIVISAESKEEADKLFNGLSAEGQIEMPISDSLGVHILVCSETNMELNGWWILTRIIRDKFSR